MRNESSPVKKLFIIYIILLSVFFISDSLFKIGLKSDLEILDNYFLIRERSKQLMDVAEKNKLFNESEIKLAGITFRGNKLKLQNSSFNYEAIYLYFNETEFQEKFRGISPFDRCLLNKVLREINKLKNKPKSIVIDIDLTPLDLNRFEAEKKRAPIKTTQGLYAVDNYYQKCESLLYETLADIARRGVIVILPAGNYVDLREGFKRYVEKKHDNIKFANWILPKNSNFVVNYLLYDYGTNQTDKNTLYTIGYFLFNNFTNINIKETKEVPLFFDKIEGSIIRNLATEIGGNTVLFLGSSVRDLHLVPLGYSLSSYIPGVQLHAIGFLSIFKYYERMETLKRSYKKWLFKIVNFLSEKFFLKAIIISLIFNNIYDKLTSLLEKFKNMRKSSSLRNIHSRLINMTRAFSYKNIYDKFVNMIKAILSLNKIKLFLSLFSKIKISLVKLLKDKILAYECIVHFVQTIKQPISVILSTVIKVILLIFIINIFVFGQKLLFNEGLIDFKFSEVLLTVLITILYEIHKRFDKKPNHDQEISNQKLTA
ncbi:MAG: hypothetical protein QXF09_06255 [Nitrososphaerota archaeon]